MAAIKAGMIPRTKRTHCRSGRWPRSNPNGTTMFKGRTQA